MTINSTAAILLSLYVLVAEARAPTLASFRGLFRTTS